MGGVREYPEDNLDDNEDSNGMGQVEIDRFPVSRLPDRYALARSAVYTRMEALGIQPQKIGNKAYINADQLRLLDELDQFIRRGGQTAEFLDLKGLQKSKPDTSNLSSGLSTVQPDSLQQIAAIAAQAAAQAIAQLMSRQASGVEPDPLEYFEKLEQAARNGWKLRTAEVAYLLKIPASEIELYGDSFTEAGFTFTKAGYRFGGEVAWSVSKSVK
jgi:hypothetical protein